jgi:para-aminobenzoate synthetase
MSLSVVADASISNGVRNANTDQYELHIKPIDIKHLWVNPADLLEEIISRRSNEQLAVSWLDSNMVSLPSISAINLTTVFSDIRCNLVQKRSPYSNFTVLSVDPAFTLTYSTLHKEITTTSMASNTKQYLHGEQTFYDHVSNIMSKYNSIPHKIIGEDYSSIQSLPFRGGLVGYFGYEMKRESMAGYHVPTEQQCHCQRHGPDAMSEANCCPCKEIPDAAFHFVDKYFAFDNRERCIYICCLVRRNNSTFPQVGVPEQAAHTWMRESEQLVIAIAEKVRRSKLEKDFVSLSPASSRGSTPDITPILKQEIFVPDTTHAKYIDSIEKCVEQIREGESYELCLTTQFRHALANDIARNACDPQLTKLYTRHLRLNNPAPFSAVLSFPSVQMSLMSSSPERFLKVDENGVVEMKPIKGTVKRCLECVCDDHPGVECDMDEECARRIVEEDERRMQTLWSDVKERAENLMVSFQQQVIIIAAQVLIFCLSFAQLETLF